MPEEYITATEARLMMGVSESKMTALLKDGEIPYKQSLRDKRIKLVKRADVEAWIERAGPPLETEKDLAA
jgi:excisionase family DNA binding protein